MVENGPESTSVVIFEGIAGIDVGGVAHDAYMTIRTEAVGYTIRWFGQFEWMGTENPDDFRPNDFFDISLSDGREGVIHVPYLSADESGKLDFLGQRMPPGFEWFTPEHVTTVELKSSTPAWRVWSSRVSAAVSALLVFAGIWVDDYRGQAIISGVLVMLLAIGLAPTPRKPLPEVPLDCPHQ